MKNKLGIQGVQPSHVVEYFSSETPPDKDTFTLSQLYEIRKRLARTEPTEVFFPDGSRATVQSWRGVVIQIVKWLAEHDKLPELPFRAHEGAKAFLDRASEGMTKAKPIDTRAGIIYFEGFNGTYQFVVRLNALCQAVGEPPDGFRVKFSRPPAVERNPQS